MKSLERLAILLVLALLSAQTISAQPAERGVLVTLRGLGPEDVGIESDLCRVLENRLGAQDWLVTCSRVPGLLGADAAEVGQASAVVPFHIDIEMSVGRQITMGVTATFVPTEETILSLSLVGPRALGIERKADTIAGEILRGMNTHLDKLGGRQALASLMAAQVTEPVVPDRADSIESEPVTETIAAESSTTELSTTEPEQSATALEPTAESTTPESITPEPQPTEETAVPTDTKEESQELKLARRSRISELGRELALLRRRRAIVIKRSRIAWIAGGALLGGAGGAWALAENNYGKYEKATASQEAIDYRERTLIYRNIAVGVGITGGGVIAGGLGYRFFAGSRSALNETIASIEQELLELRSVPTRSP